MYLLLERAAMPEQLQNILWMSEELAFDLRSEQKADAVTSIKRFLEVATNPALTHWLY